MKKFLRLLALTLLVVGFTVGTVSAPASSIVYIDPSTQCASGGYGYWLVASDGGIFSFGDAAYHGSMGGLPLNKPIVGMATTATGNGYYLVASDGGVFTFGDAEYFGSTGNIKLNAPVIGMKATSSGNGYWLFAKDGGVFTFGDAQHLGGVWPGYYPQIYQVGADADSWGTGATNQSYWQLSQQGFVNIAGDAPGTSGTQPQTYFGQPLKGYVSVSRTENADGYWVTDSKGGVYTGGNAPFHGSAGNIHLARPIVTMVPYWFDEGYWLVASDGGIFSYGVPFCGSTGAIQLNKPIVGASRVGFPI